MDGFQSIHPSNLYSQLVTSVNQVVNHANYHVKVCKCLVECLLAVLLNDPAAKRHGGDEGA